MTKIIQGLLDALSFILSVGTTEVTFTDTEVAVVSKTWSYFGLIGVCLSIVYFLIEMNKKYALEGGDMNFKTFFAPFLKLTIAIIFLMYGSKIIGTILEISNVWAAEFSSQITFGTIETADGSISSFSNDLATFGILEIVVLFIPIILVFICGIIIRLIWGYKAILYKLEVLFRISVSPIALADIYSGQNSGAIRWIKGFIALGLYGAALTVLPKLGLTFAATNLAEGIFSAYGGDAVMAIWKEFLGVAQFIVAPFAAVSCASVAKQACKEALGV